MSEYTIVPAAETKRIIASGATILDVRQPGEHEEMRLVAAHDFMPLDQVDAVDFMLRRGLDKEAPVYMLCRSGMRARKAADKFTRAGYKNIFVIDGGILACESCNVPIEGSACGGTTCATNASSVGGCA